jgi:16S rRNA (adenine1518-N6/adenine1519-N6)-dimethyltransferase
VTVRSPRELLERYGLRAKKSWGQNFLVDERTYRAIVEAAGAGAGDLVIEIGAGLGTLTARLLATGARVIAVERDRDMARVVRGELGSEPRLELAEANALEFDYAEAARAAGRRAIVVGNLPYQIASPILFRLLAQRAELERLVVMLQREVAERIVAAPSSAAYGALSVMVQVAGAPRIVCKVPAGAFLPAPKVASAVVRIDLVAGTRVPLDDQARFGEVVHAAFGQRRKTLKNALSTIADGARVAGALGRAGIDGQRRGETLSVEEFARLSDALPR